MNQSFFFEEVLRTSLGSTIKLRSSSFIGGGCINNCLKLSTTQGNYFLKWNRYELDLFEKESRDLDRLAALSPFQIPVVINQGCIDKMNYLLLEFIDSAHPSSRFWENFGLKLSEQHRVTHESFGLDYDNHIGRLPQLNTPTDSWIEFFLKNRLKAQVQQAEINGKIPTTVLGDFEKFIQKLPSLLSDEPPALLHGDLWSGNFMVGPDGEASILDPAIYYGHREAEIAFTHLFGGFDQVFYESYNHHFRLDSEFKKRMDIYNLYPLVVHLNLFGESYLSSIKQILKKYI